VTLHEYDTNEQDLLATKVINNGTPELVASYTYRPTDPPHLPATVTNALGETTTNTYDSHGKVLTTTNPKGETTSFSYDTQGNLLQVTGAAPGATTTFTYDGYGRLRTVRDPAGYTLTTDYDALDRPTRVTHPDGTYEQTVYGRLDAEQQRDRLGRWTRTFYDALRRPIAFRDAAGAVTRQEWCDCGSLDSLTDANGNTTTWERDIQGRVTREVRANGSDIQFTYEATTSRLKQRTDQKGVVTTYDYFLDGALQRKSYSDGTTPDATYTYDHRGLLASAANGTDTLTWSYDLAGRMVSEQSAKNASTVAYTYDPAGNRATVSLDGAPFASYGYDTASRLTSITRESNVFSFAYDSSSRRTSMTYPNGVVTSYDYDNASRLTRITAQKDATVITDFNYTYNVVDNRTQKATPDLVEDYGYDALDQLTTVTRSGAEAKYWRYVYDKVGNRTSEQVDDAVTGATHDNMNRLLSRKAGGALGVSGSVSEPATVTVQGAPAPVAADNTFHGAATVAEGTSEVDVTATDPSGNVRTSTYEVTQGTGTSATYTYDANGNLATKVQGGATWAYGWNAENQLGRDRAVSLRSRGAAGRERRQRRKDELHLRPRGHSARGTQYRHDVQVRAWSRGRRATRVGVLKHVHVLPHGQPGQHREQNRPHRNGHAHAPLRCVRRHTGRGQRYGIRLHW